MRSILIILGGLILKNFGLGSNKFGPGSGYFSGWGHTRNHDVQDKIVSSVIYFFFLRSFQATTFWNCPHYTNQTHSNSSMFHINIESLQMNNTKWAQSLKGSVWLEPLLLGQDQATGLIESGWIIGQPNEVLSQTLTRPSPWAYKPKPNAGQIRAKLGKPRPLANGFPTIVASIAMAFLTITT